MSERQWLGERGIMDWLKVILGLEIQGAVELTRGRNNRVFEMAGGGDRFCLKVFFRHEADRRDRFGHELQFLKFCEGGGVGGVPRVLGHDLGLGVIVTEWIAGRAPREEDVTRENIGRILEVVRQMNDVYGGDGFCSDLPVASEACFSLGEHLELVEGRVMRLAGVLGRERQGAELAGGGMQEAGIVGEGDVFDAARDFVKTRLWHRFLEVKKDFLFGLVEGEMDAVLLGGERCVSPSDFGFHNVLMGEDGLVYLIDFEYGGMDDPAKLVCDFLYQVKYSLPRFAGRMAIEMLNKGGDAAGLGRLERRVERLKGLYGVKWSCMMLNEFLVAGNSRRCFALGEAVDEAGLWEQLEKAEAVLGGWCLNK